MNKNEYVRVKNIKSGAIFTMAQKDWETLAKRKTELELTNDPITYALPRVETVEKKEEKKDPKKGAGKE